MKVELFNYTLPPELIAQFPTRRRDRSRVMVLDRNSGATSIHPFRHILDHLSKRDALVINTTRVFKARLLGRRATGAKVEVFLVRRIQTDQKHNENRDNVPVPWEAMVNPSRRVKEGEWILFDSMRVLLNKDLGGGRWEVVFESRWQCEHIIGRYGHVPLPHYIRREDQPADIRRYQTVFADKHRVGAVAAPTAGFHFTRPLLREIRDKGVTVVEVCLHVGPGTFKPVRADDIEGHTVDPEFAELTPQAAATLNDVRSNNGSIFAVGTTSVRTLESAPITNGEIQPFAGMVDLYIRPGFTFKVVDRLITNFHLPRSSLLILASAFAGRERILAAYREAVSARMRFYSYGDAMLIL
ncbi:MAG: tRNA preQ1(34) S-adenosylmethionine ribosyltransferase-isomerase QueA [Candidatus Zixiibacteriota bacterium]